ncbi:hypothetical protein CN563_23160 [Bacillus sp. AFS026049]|uniref:DUF4083 family protein n=1 Tax=Peribacillus frigoritolerans TaxID=450367 RepID=UPI000BFA8328|nr:hypothetical protein CN563_23160 [Bacillus sp. AFS026049]
MSTYYVYFVAWYDYCGLLYCCSLLARSNKSNSIEQKLDRVIELLEKDKRE